MYLDKKFQTFRLRHVLCDKHLTVKSIIGSDGPQLIACLEELPLPNQEKLDEYDKNTRIIFKPKSPSTHYI